MTKITSVQKEALLALSGKLSDELVSLGSEVDSIKGKLSSVENYDGMNFAGAANIISQNLVNVTTALGTVSTNVQSYIQDVQALDTYDVTDEEAPGEELEPPELDLPTTDQENPETTPDEETKPEEEPETTPDQDKEETKPETTPGQDKEETNPETTPGQDKEETKPETTPGQDKEETKPETTPGQDKEETKPETTPGQDKEETKPETTPGQDKEETKPETTPGQDKEETKPETTPGQDKEETKPETTPGGQQQGSSSQQNPSQGNSNSGNGSTTRPSQGSSNGGSSSQQPSQPAPSQPTTFVPHEQTASSDISYSVGNPNIDVSKYTNNAELGYNVTTGNLAYELGAEDYNLLCAIVASESDGSYDNTLAIVSTILNRCETGDWKAQYGMDPIAQITAANQFSGYTTGEFQSYIGNVSSIIHDAVNDGLAGVRNHKSCSY